MPDSWAELPPTAGLPPRCADLWPFGAHVPLLPPGIAEDAALLLCSGTAALVVALQTLQRGSARREVVVPAYTCPLVALAVAHCGLRLRLCDLADDSLDFDAAALAEVCNADTLAVVVTHLGGRVADLAMARRVADAAGAALIEDAAQAWGGRHGDMPLGLVGDIGFFSLAVGKGITVYEGGLLVARDAPHAGRIDRTAAAGLGVAPQRGATRVSRAVPAAGFASGLRLAASACAAPRRLDRCGRRRFRRTHSAARHR